MMVDANARVGSVQSSAVGPQCPDEEDEGGSAFHEFLLATGQVAVATFMQSAPTWQSASSIEHRIDYVTVPSCWAASVTQTGVFGFDLLALDGHLDHASPWVEVLLQVERKPEQRRKLWYARQAMKLPEVQEAVSAEWACALPLPTSWDSELASAALQSFPWHTCAQTGMDFKYVAGPHAVACC